MTDKRDNVQGDETSITISKDELQSMISQIVAQTVGPIVNSAITQRNSSFEKSVLKEVQTLLGSKTASPEEETASSKSKKSAQDPELVAMKAEIDKMKAEKAELVAKERDGSLRKFLNQELSKAGVRPEMIKHAIATLVDSDKTVGYTSDEYAQDKDRMVFKSKSGEEDLTTGLKNWIRSDEGKVFLPPKGAQGSGDKSYSAAKKNGSPEMSDASFVNILTNLRNG